MGRLPTDYEPNDDRGVSRLLLRIHCHKPDGTQPSVDNRSESPPKLCMPMPCRLVKHESKLYWPAKHFGMCNHKLRAGPSVSLLHSDLWPAPQINTSTLDAHASVSDSGSPGQQRSAESFCRACPCLS